MMWLRHALLEALAVPHGFGTREARDPHGLVRPKQVHGVRVARVTGGRAEPVEADAIVAGVAEGPVGVVTADCVPVLAASGDGRAVAAIHAGWRGLAAGVVEAGMAALKGRAGEDASLFAVVGPCIGGCCYEVDAPVIDALGARFGADLEAGIRPAGADRADHWLLDLGTLAMVELARCGVATEHRARLPGACTRCEPERFHSFRRDGDSAGRLVHWVAARGAR